MKIGIVGAGFIGRAIAAAASGQGHEVMIANSRDPRTLGSTAVALGCATGTAEEAARFGEVVVVSIPFSAISGLDPAPYEGKIVIDTCNHYPARDGEDAALAANEDTTGGRLAQHLPGARVVKAFNAILQGDLVTDPRPAGDPERRALPIAGDDAGARAVVAGLLDEWGFDVVDAGPMAESWRFERGKPGYCIRLDRAGMEQALAAARKGVAAPYGSWRRDRGTPAAQPARGIAGRGAIDIVDGQFHLGLEHGTEATLAAMDALGIRAMIAYESWGQIGGAPSPAVMLEGGHARAIPLRAVEAAILHPDRFAFVQRITRHDPDLEVFMRITAQSPGCRGFRVILGSRAERDALLAGDWDRAFAVAADLGLPVAFLSARLPGLAREIARRFPGLTLVIDHCGWAGSTGEWDEVIRLGDLPGTVLKWSHPNRTFRHFDDPGAMEAQGLLDAVASFGAGRIFWASDATHEETRQSWAESLAAVRYHPGLGEAERGLILAGTVRRVFGLGAPGGAATG
ncbi:amidohydrolase family protein [Salipiger sp.]|uniref:amidohydrolase family protein n=1 Tax=Salipiger sp. TaxID=2078585 RepID=UPI003A96F6D9